VLQPIVYELKFIIYALSPGVLDEGNLLSKLQRVKLSTSKMHAKYKLISLLVVLGYER